MGENDKNQNDEYKKRIKELIDNVEKNVGRDDDETYDTPEKYQKLLEAMERAKQAAISKIDPDYRNGRILIVFIQVIRDYYLLRADPKFPTKEDQFKDEIDQLYRLVYEDLKKPNLSFLHYSPEERKKMEKKQRRTVVNTMVAMLGLENVSNDFYKRYNINPLILKDTYMKEVCIFVVVFIAILFFVLVFILSP